MICVKAPLSKDSCIVMCGSYSLLSSKEKYIMKHDSNNSFNSLDHTQQPLPGCPPRACAQHSAVNHKQVPAQALLPVL